MKRLSTKWAETVTPDHVKPEYPRPGLVRDSYYSLNGLWDFCVNGEAGAAIYDRTILVPFSPEAPLSGVNAAVRPENYLHYRKVVQLPQGFVTGRVLLHFGAVDQQCQVSLNGQEIGRHEGGYLPFCLDVTRYLAPGENRLEVCARDQTERAPYARGKQKLVRKGKYGSIFYTPTSGIWKSVWMESVPQHYVTGLRITPNYEKGRVDIQVNTTRPGTARLSIAMEGELVYQGTVATDAPASIDLPDFVAWSPDAPHLYDVTITYGEDEVRSYFGMRLFERRLDERGVPRFYLNKKPFFFNGLLDQGYWPDGLLTAPSDQALEHDIKTAKALGYNTLRKHVKVEEDRFYFLCDRIGMAVWQDMPNGGGDYNVLLVTYLPNALNWFARGFRDNRYRALKRADERGRAQYDEELEGMIEHLYNHPCIALWTPFNEGWGQFDANKATQKIRALDPTRLINEASGWFDQGGGDVYSIHNYIKTLRVKPRPDRVTAVTEYGGYAYPVKDHTPCDKEFGYQVYTSSQELTKNYQRLWEQEIYPNLERGLSAAIYTQLSDVEEEINGLMTYDRAVVKMEPEAVKALNRRLYEQFAALTKR